MACYCVVRGSTMTATNHHHDGHNNDSHKTWQWTLWPTYGFYWFYTEDCLCMTSLVRCQGVPGIWNVSLFPTETNSWLGKSRFTRKGNVTLKTACACVSLSVLGGWRAACTVGRWRYRTTEAVMKVPVMTTWWIWSVRKTWRRAFLSAKPSCWPSASTISLPFLDPLTSTGRYILALLLHNIVDLTPSKEQRA